MTTERAWGHPLPGPLNVEPRGVSLVEARAMLTAAAEGLPLGAYDHRILAWAAGWDQPTIATLASVIWRARQEPPPR